MTTASEALGDGRPAARAGRALWLIAALSIAVGLYGLSYLVGRPAPPGPAANAAYYPWLPIHAVCAGAALLIGPWQFFAAIRRRWPAVHHWTGRTYVTLCAIAGSAGLILAWNTSSGPVARYGFLTLAIVWLGCTGMAYACALRRDFVAHRAWMTRSFALTFAAVTLRAYLPFSALPHLSFAIVYPLTAWVSWIPNLAVAEWWLRSGPRPRI
ncbi:MAG TPA: DUF2306 domain-containing protein [Caulobacteraceae bacterium]|nr:DUF2306 domain-containing protein [Caulobacteraceae bacterium]